MNTLRVVVTKIFAILEMVAYLLRVDTKRGIIVLLSVLVKKLSLKQTLAKNTSYL